MAKADVKPYKGRITCVLFPTPGTYLGFFQLIEDHDNGEHEGEPTSDCTVCVHEVLDCCEMLECWCRHPERAAG